MVNEVTNLALRAAGIAVIGPGTCGDPTIVRPQDYLVPFDGSVLTVVNNVI
jgi:hypothetical protein